MTQEQWDEAFRLLHALWGKNKAGKYDKEQWMQLLALMEEARRADGVVAPSQRPPPPTRKVRPS